MLLAHSLFADVTDNCYVSANIKALETLGYAEHIFNYVVISDNCFSGKISVFLYNPKLQPIDWISIDI